MTPSRWQALLASIASCVVFSMATEATGQQSGKTASMQQRDVTLIEDLVYADADGRPLRLDLRLPNQVQDPPLVVWIHGGGWRGGSKARPPIRRITEHGYALASIEYRFTDTAIFPAQIHDCKAAVRWLRGNATKYGYDANQIAVAGSSAGGHLALLMGTSAGVETLEGTLGDHLDQSSSVQCVIDYYGPSDFVLREKTQPDRALTTKSGSFALLGGLRDGKPDNTLKKLASPAMHVSADDPPLLIFQGTDDKTVLMDQSERMRDAYSEAGLAVELIVVPDAGHGGAVFFAGPNFDRFVETLRQYLGND